MVFSSDIAILRSNRAAHLRPQELIEEYRTCSSPICSKRYRAWLRYRQTLNELSRLSERELADVGLNRYDIDTTGRAATRRSDASRETGRSMPLRDDTSLQ